LVEIGEGKTFRPGILKEVEEEVQLVHERMETTQSRQKIYAYPKQREVKFKNGDFIYLRVTLLKGMQHFHFKGKLAPR
jgi:hypothetical protein